MRLITVGVQPNGGADEVMFCATHHRMAALAWVQSLRLHL